MEQITNYETVTVSVDNVDYTVSFTAVELWHGVDNGIGPYDYFGAYGVHEQWEWEFDSILDIDDFVLHEYMNEFEKEYTHEAKDLNKEFVDKLMVACIKYAEDNAEEPKENPKTYDRYSHVDPESYWENRRMWKYYDY
jgi:hypothetical protein